MTLHSRLPTDFTLEERVAVINRLCNKLSQRDAQIERLRWRVAIELHTVQKIVLADGLQWEAWCEANISRSLSDIRKLLKMAEAHDPEAAHEAEKAGRRKNKGSNTAKRSHVIALAEPERDAGKAYAARQLVGAILAEFSPKQARGMLELIDIGDLIDALDAAGSPPERHVPVVSTATH